MLVIIDCGSEHIVLNNVAYYSTIGESVFIYFTAPEAGNLAHLHLSKEQAREFLRKVASASQGENIHALAHV